MQIPTTGTLKVSSARHLSPKILKWMTQVDGAASLHEEGSLPTALESPFI